MCEEFQLILFTIYSTSTKEREKNFSVNVFVLNSRELNLGTANSSEEQQQTRKDTKRRRCGENSIKSHLFSTPAG